MVEGHMVEGHMVEPTYFRLDSEGQLRWEDGDDAVYSRKGILMSFDSIAEAQEWVSVNFVQGIVR